MSEQKKYPDLEPLVLEGPGPFALIGDIHGCADELQELVDKVTTQLFGNPHDNLNITWISLGDVTDRGPDVHRCFDILRSIGAHKVLGNHDEKFIRYHKGNKVKIGPSQEVSLASMKKEDFEDLKNFVPFVRLPFYNVIGVHGGFFAGKRPEEQDLKQMIRLRYIDPDNRKLVAVTDPGAVFWAEVWKGPEMVLFGHAWAKEVQRFPKAFGLDTGCVYGNKLTAMVLRNAADEMGADADLEDQPVGEIVQVDAKQVYWEDTHGLERD